MYPVNIKHFANPIVKAVIFERMVTKISPNNASRSHSLEKEIKVIIDTAMLKKASATLIQHYNVLD